MVALDFLIPYLFSVKPRTLDSRSDEKRTSRRRHPTLFVSSSVTASELATESPLPTYLQSTIVTDDEPSEALGLVDLTSHVKGISLLGLTNISISLQLLQNLSPNEDLILR